jgi:hypothetical protein
MMYWFEQGDYETGKQVAEEELRRGRRRSPEEVIAQAKIGGITLTRKQFENHEPYDHQERLCERIDDQGLLHACNETWLEVRTWNNDIRGITTLFGWGIYAGMGWFLLQLWLDISVSYRTGFNSIGLPMDAGDLRVAAATMTGMVLFQLAVAWVFHRYFMRYELLTHRWIRLRFNRKTKKVYLLRPKYAGGLMVFDWTDTDPSLNKDVDPSASFLIWPALVWGSETELGRPTVMQFIARRTSFKTTGDWMAFWEYIRRYMEEGPQAVPKPKAVIGYWPSIKEAWISVTQWYPAFQQQGAIGKISDGITLLILPLIVLMFVGNFVGQCLTWQARFPREIEDAGQGD